MCVCVRACLCLRLCVCWQVVILLKQYNYNMSTTLGTCESFGGTSAAIGPVVSRSLPNV